MTLTELLVNVPIVMLLSSHTVTLVTGHISLTTIRDSNIYWMARPFNFPVSGQFTFWSLLVKSQLFHLFDVLEVKLNRQKYGFHANGMMS